MLLFRRDKRNNFKYKCKLEATCLLNNAWRKRDIRVQKGSLEIPEDGSDEEEEIDDLLKPKINLETSNSEFENYISVDNDVMTFDILTPKDIATKIQA